MEILLSDIGYVKFTNFGAPNSFAKKTVNSVMQIISHIDELTIDLRNNFGGKK
ncbi:MAG: hypothetical protein E2590_03720 [Chryseobacterium sp.]|nr:hypothetical protein [Chryseobacterium sp.]